MITETFRVVACGEPESYKTSNGNQSQKRQLRLQVFGGWNGNDDPAILPNPSSLNQIFNF
jgi:hypothetical protein